MSQKMTRAKTVFGFFLLPTIEAILTVEQTESFKLDTDGTFTIERENMWMVKDQRSGKGTSKSLVASGLTNMV